MLDRAGVTGQDGASHNGMWDMAILQVVPGLRLAAPRDARDAARGAARGGRGRRRARPSCATRRARWAPDLPALERVDGVDVLRRDGDDVLLVAVGAMAGTCLEVAERCAQQGIGVTVVDPRWVKPVPGRSSRMAAGVPARRGRSRTTCAPAASARRSPRRCATPGSTTPLRDFGIPLRFLDHAKRAEVLAEIGLTAQDIARDIVETVSSLDRAVEQHAVND